MQDRCGPQNQGRLPPEVGVHEIGNPILGVAQHATALLWSLFGEAKALRRPDLVMLQKRACISSNKALVTQEQVLLRPRYLPECSSPLTYHFAVGQRKMPPCGRGAMESFVCPDASRLSAMKCFTNKDSKDQTCPRYRDEIRIPTILYTPSLLRF